MEKNYEYKLSVVVLVYNTEYYLKACLDSLVNQTLDDIEIICVNDESTDNSLNILKKYAQKYDNIKIIDQKNQGGANAGNNGLKIAKGEYVTLIDSDDIVFEDAYELLYNKAKETNSDIVGGKPSTYLNGYLREVSNKHNIWLTERTIDINKDFDIYQDVFYWDKIYKRELIQDNNVYMIPDKLYADAPFVFLAYFFANKITLIPQSVYYWRKRSTDAISKGNTYTSLTKSLLNVDNMHDRLVTYYYLKDYFKKYSNKENFITFIKIYFERFFYPINGISMDETFKNNYLNELIEILTDINNMTDIYDNDLHIIYNLYTYFILNNQIDTLEEFLTIQNDKVDVYNENGKDYWNLKYFRNEKYNIPDKLFEINYIHENFINISNLDIDSKFLYINNIRLPKSIKIDEHELVLVGLTKKDHFKENNIYKFDLQSNGDNVFFAKVPLSKIRNLNIYDVFFKFAFNNRDEIFRLKTTNFEEIYKHDIEKNEKVIPYFSKLGNLSIANGFSKGIFNIEADENKVKIKLNDKGDINYRLFINYIKKNEQVFFKRTVDDNGKLKNEFELEWKYSIDYNIPYTLYIKINNKNFKLTIDYFSNFEDKMIDYNGRKLKLFKDKDNSISLRLK